MLRSKTLKAEPKYKNGIYHELHDKFLIYVYKGILVWMGIYFIIHFIYSRKTFKEITARTIDFENTAHLLEYDDLIVTANDLIRNALAVSRSVVSNLNHNKFDATKNYATPFVGNYLSISYPQLNASIENPVFAIWSTESASLSDVLLNEVSYYHPFWRLFQIANKSKGTEIIYLDYNYYYTNLKTLDLITYQDVCMQSMTVTECQIFFSETACLKIIENCANVTACIFKYNSNTLTYDIRCIPEIQDFISNHEATSDFEFIQTASAGDLRVCAMTTKSVVCQIFEADPSDFNIPPSQTNTNFVSLRVYKGDLSAELATIVSPSAFSGNSSSCNEQSLEKHLATVLQDSKNNYTSLNTNGFALKYMGPSTCAFNILLASSSISFDTSLIDASTEDTQNVLIIAHRNSTLSGLFVGGKKSSFWNFIVRMSLEVIVVQTLCYLIMRKSKTIADEVRKFLEKMSAILRKIETRKDYRTLKTWIEEVSVEKSSRYNEGRRGGIDIVYDARLASFNNDKMMSGHTETSELLTSKNLLQKKNPELLKIEQMQEALDNNGFILSECDYIVFTNIFDLKELKSEILNFGYAVTHHKQRMVNDVRIEILLKMENIFREKANFNGLEIVCNDIVKWHIENGDYSLAIKVMKEIAEILEKRKDSLIRKNEEYTDEMEKTNWKLFVNYYRILNVVKKDLMYLEDNQRTNWDYAMDVFRKIFSFIDEMQVEGTVITKLMLKKAGILVYLGKVGHALEALSETQEYYENTLKNEKLQLQLNYENKMISYLQQKIYLIYGNLYLSSKDYFRAYQYYMKCLDHGSVYTPQVRIRCLEGIAEILKQIKAPESQQGLIRNLKGFFSDTGRRFLFLIDSTPPLNEMLPDVMSIIKELFFNKLKEKDQLGVFRFADDIDEVLKIKSYESVKNNPITSFDLIYDKLKKHANKTNRNFMHSIVQLLEQQELEELSSSDSGSMVSSSERSIKPCYVICFLFGDEETTISKPFQKRRVRRIMTNFSNRHQTENVLEAHLEKIEESFLYLLLIVMDKGINPESEKIKIYKKACEASKFGTVILIDPTRQESFASGVKEILDFV